MSILKRWGDFLGVIFRALFLCFLISCAERQKKEEKIVAEGRSPISIDTIGKPNEWLKHIDQLDITDSCIRKVVNLVHYLDTETLSSTFTFERYKINDTISGPLAALDIKSCGSARSFRTNIAYELSKTGINFAGKYSIVSVGMTGSGDNYWLVDRTNGKAYEFSYWAEDISYRKNSNLIIVYPRDVLQHMLENTSDPKELCADRFGEPQQQSDLRPTYFLWRNNKLFLLGQKKTLLPKNESFDYWRNYYKH